MRRSHTNLFVPATVSGEANVRVADVMSEPKRRPGLCILSSDRSRRRFGEVNVRVADVMPEPKRRQARRMESTKLPRPVCIGSMRASALFDVILDIGFVALLPPPVVPLLVGLA